MSDFAKIDPGELDRYITGNWGEDSVPDDIDAVEEPDPTKPRPGEPGWSPFDPWEDPAFEWFREENRKAKDDEEMIAIPLADAVRIRDFMEDIQNRVGLGYELESLPPDEEAVLERLNQALAGKTKDGDCGGYEDGY